MTDEHWLAAFQQVHLSTVRFIRAVLPDMKKKKWGRILAIQSSSVKQPVEGLILSNGIRPGIAGMFKTLAVFAVLAVGGATAVASMTCNSTSFPSARSAPATSSDPDGG